MVRTESWLEWVTKLYEANKTVQSLNMFDKFLKRSNFVVLCQIVDIVDKFIDVILLIQGNLSHDHC